MQFYFLDIHNKPWEHKRKEKYKTTYQLIQHLPSKRGQRLSAKAKKFCHFGNIMNVLFIFDLLSPKNSHHDVCELSLTLIWHGCCMCALWQARKYCQNVWILALNLCVPIPTILSLCVPNPAITFHVCRRLSTEKGWREVEEAFENLDQNVFTDLCLKI